LRALPPILGVQAVEGNPQTREVTVIQRKGAVSDGDLAARITDVGHVVAGVHHETDGA